MGAREITVMRPDPRPAGRIQEGGPARRVSGGIFRDEALGQACPRLVTVCGLQPERGCHRCRCRCVTWTVTVTPQHSDEKSRKKEKKHTNTKNSGIEILHSCCWQVERSQPVVGSETFCSVLRLSLSFPLYIYFQFLRRPLSVIDEPVGITAQARIFTQCLFLAWQLEEKKSLYPLLLCLHQSSRA